jgi:hypothetical protein
MHVQRGSLKDPPPPGCQATQWTTGGTPISFLALWPVYICLSLAVGSGRSGSSLRGCVLTTCCYCSHVGGGVLVGPAAGQSTPGFRAAFLVDPVDGTTATAQQPGYPSAVDALRGQGKLLGITGVCAMAAAAPHVFGMDAVCLQPSPLPPGLADESRCVGARVQRRSCQVFVGVCLSASGHTLCTLVVTTLTCCAVLCRAVVCCAVCVCVFPGAAHQVLAASAPAMVLPVPPEIGAASGLLLVLAAG